MPVTRSELLFLCGGAVAGAIGAKNFDKIKAQAAPWLAKAAEAAGDAYTVAARQVAERIEAVQDAMAEAKKTAGPSDADAHLRSAAPSPQPRPPTARRGDRGASPGYARDPARRAFRAPTESR